MSHHQHALAERRRELVERSAAQRAALVGKTEPLLRKAVALDRVVGSVRRHPLVTGVTAGAVVLLGGRRLFELASRAIALYALLRQQRP